MNKLKSIFHKGKKHAGEHDEGHVEVCEHVEARKQFEGLSLNENSHSVGMDDDDDDETCSSNISLSSAGSSSLLSLDETEDGEMETPRMIFIEQDELVGYRLLDKIGEGAFSKVFKGINTDTREYVAIKVIKKQNLSSSGNNDDDDDTAQHIDTHKGKSSSKIEQVLKEVTLHKMISSLQCVNIVQFIEFKETRHFYYIVQELLTGGEIFNSIVKYTYFSEDLSRHVIRQLGHAVKSLHSIGIVHRDIKPENLLYEPIEYVPNASPILRKSDDPMTKMDEGVFRPGIGGGGIGVVKLTDFGLSKQIYQTNTKTPCGTVGYTAPEVVKDERYSMKVDMWGVGCVLYTMLCGFPPFYDDKIDILTEKISRGEYTFLTPWWDEISDGAKECVSKLLEVDPMRRYTIDEFMNDPWLNCYDSKQMGEEEGWGIVDMKRHRKSNNKKKKKLREMMKLKEDPSLLYSPAAVAMRDAFDISNALKRDQAAMSPNNKRKGLYSLEEEEGEGEGEGELNGGDGEREREREDEDERCVFNTQLQEQEHNLFELNLNTSTILQRRQKKQRMASPLGTNIPVMSGRVKL